MSPCLPSGSLAAHHFGQASLNSPFFWGMACDKAASVLLAQAQRPCFCDTATSRHGHSTFFSVISSAPQPFMQRHTAPTVSESGLSRGYTQKFRAYLVGEARPTSGFLTQETCFSRSASAAQTPHFTSKSMSFAMLFPFVRRKKTAPAPAQNAAPSRAQALEFIPVINSSIDVEHRDKGSCRLHYELALKPWFVRAHERLRKAPFPPQKKTLELDEIGSLVWSLIDGRHSVGAIAKTLGETYELEAREAELSTSTFLRELGRRGLIALLPPHDPSRREPK